MNDPGLKEILTLKSRASPYSLLLDSVNSFKDIPEPFPFISHRGTASRRTLAWIRSRRPRTEKQWNAVFDGREKWNTAINIVKDQGRSKTRPLWRQESRETGGNQVRCWGSTTSKPACAAATFNS